MKYILLLFCTIQLAFSQTYQYKESVLSSLYEGCIEGGGTKKACLCQVDFFTHNVPPTELNSLHKSMLKIFLKKDVDTIPSHNRILILNLVKQCSYK